MSNNEAEMGGSLPFYYSDSVSAGSYHFSLSSDAPGLSVSTTGLRVGKRPRSHYVHVGGGRLSYRASVNAEVPQSQPQHGWEPAGMGREPVVSSEPGVQMVEISSSNVLQMTDEGYGNILTELNAKQDTGSSLPLLIFFVILASSIAIFIFGLIGAVFGSLLLIAALFVGIKLDEHRRSVVVVYDLEPDAAVAYAAMAKAFDDLAASSMKWHIDAGGAVRDLHTWKRNAGAATIVRRFPTTFSYALPSFITTNVTPPYMQVGKETLYWFPDVILVVERGKVGAVAYGMLEIRWEDSRFIEDENLPRDANVVGHVWKHPNKNGGPDRRFSDNRLLPVCLYEAIHLRSRSGLNELLEVSTTGRTAAFAETVRQLTATIGIRDNMAASPDF